MTVVTRPINVNSHCDQELNKYFNLDSFVGKYDLNKLVIVIENQSVIALLDPMSSFCHQL